ncbi:unnamed protein product [Danaus chrysippus]|uniref:(African queen) hypothetical protein n=1 Tax=Danaus chrysippus TaxID=151541 RepID=A0A8J2VWV4_9NEOP|nr:unnamed protein product [Danaus chrysippus]
MECRKQKNKKPLDVGGPSSGGREQGDERPSSGEENEQVPMAPEQVPMAPEQVEDVGMETSSPAPYTFQSPVGRPRRLPVPGSLSKSSSVISFMSATSGEEDTSRLWRRKRGRKNLSDSSQTASETETGEPMSAKAKVKKRGRGRPPTTGKYVGLAAAKRSLAEADLAAAEAQAENAAAEAQAEQKLAQQPTEICGSQPRLVAMSGGEKDRDLVAVASSYAEAVLRVAKSSSQLKGTSQKALKDAAAGFKDVVEAMARRTVNDETRRLRDENQRMQERLLATERQIAELRAQTAQGEKRAAAAPLTVSPEAEVDALVGLITSRIMARIDARYGHLLKKENLRPPLAADKKRAATTAATTANELTVPAGTFAAAVAGNKGKGKKSTAAAAAPAEKSGAEPVPTSTATETAPDRRAGEKKKKKKKKTATAAKPASTIPASQEGTWQVVGEKKKVAKAARKKAAVTKQQAKSMRTPKSAAVTLALQPGAVDAGVTYAGNATSTNGYKGLSVE